VDGRLDGHCLNLRRFNKLSSAHGIGGSPSVLITIYCTEPHSIHFIKKNRPPRTLDDNYRGVSALTLSQHTHWGHMRKCRLKKETTLRWWVLWCFGHLVFLAPVGTGMFCWKKYSFLGFKFIWEVYIYDAFSHFLYGHTGTSYKLVYEWSHKTVSV
jgi:hypothetical protein